jgi:hypothetical protein
MGAGSMGASNSSGGDSMSNGSTSGTMNGNGQSSSSN